MGNKRLISDNIWLSDKIGAMTDDGMRAEYLWLYTLALCDGTFECDPKKIWARCYAPQRDMSIWTLTRVSALIDELDRVGLLVRRADPEGKVWAKWVGCDEFLPPRSEWHKHKRGKGFLFDEETAQNVASQAPAISLPSASAPPANGSQGFGLGLGLGRVGEGRGDDAGASSLADLLPDSIVEERKPRPDGADHNGRKKGDPGFYERGQYHGTDPKKINNRLIAKVWQSVKKESAFAIYPSKFPEKWEALVSQVSVDIIIPAFELWCMEEGLRSTTRCPAGDFSRVAEKYTQMIIAPAAVKPVTSQADIDAAKVRAKLAHFEQWGLDVNGNVPKSEEEPGADQF